MLPLSRIPHAKEAEAHKSPASLVVTAARFSRRLHDAHNTGNETDVFPSSPAAKSRQAPGAPFQLPLSPISEPFPGNEIDNRTSQGLHPPEPLGPLWRRHVPRASSYEEHAVDFIGHKGQSLKTRSAFPPRNSPLTSSSNPSASRCSSARAGEIIGEFVPKSTFVLPRPLRYSTSSVG